MSMLKGEKKMHRLRRGKRCTGLREEKICRLRKEKRCTGLRERTDA